METPAGQNPPAPQNPGEDRRHRKEDGWSRALRLIALATYPLLILNLFILVGVASRDRTAIVVSQYPGQPSPQLTSSEVYLHAYLPIMAVGMLVGVVGILLDRIRTRRRRDRKYKSQLLCILLSVVGVALFFWLR
jgi:hypothetical protein